MAEPWRTPPQFVATPGEPSKGAARPGGGAAPLPFGGGGGGGALPGFVRTVPPVNEVKPPQGQDFIVGGNLAGASVVTTPAVVTGVTFTVPLGSVGYIRSVVFQVQQVLVTSDIAFAVRVDQTPVQGWARVPVLPAAIAVWSQSWGPEEVYVEVQPGRTVDITVTVLDGGAYNVGAIMHGWTVPSALADASRAGWDI